MEQLKTHQMTQKKKPPKMEEIKKIQRNKPMRMEEEIMAQEMNLMKNLNPDQKQLQP